ncbi:hypothetical protein ABE096_21360 [Robertmurraya massiliosenegalensis]|uniref:hypothetical protein n=1 Tax=Robertmurraya TaxID=2837507 RepID=UPI0039A7830D
MYKKWFFKTTLPTISILLFIGVFNYFIDPLWSFNHSHKFNDYQNAFNERQQKTNYINFHKFSYDSLLLGSSRTTYINQNDFEGYKVYNYAVSSMSVQEYNEFIDYAKKENGSEFKTIIIGLDFFATSKSRIPEDPSIYFNKTNEFLYRYKTLLSIDTLKYSIMNFFASYKNEYNPSFLRYYTRENVANENPESNNDTEKSIEKTVERYKQNVYGKNYSYNNNYIDILQELKIKNSNTNFIVFTTPVSASLYNTLIEEGRLNDYKRWLKDIVSVFGEVYHFMYINSVTENISNYYDGHHYHPKVGTLIAHKITNYPDRNIPNDFGILLNKKNIHIYLDKLENNFIK